MQEERPSQTCKKNIGSKCILRRSLPRTCVICIHPLGISFTATCFRCLCKETLEGADAWTIDSSLRQVIVFTHHTENGSCPKSILCHNFIAMAVQLLRMPIRKLTKALLEIWKQCVKARMAQAENPLMYQSKNSNVPSENWRREVVILECRLLRHPQLDNIWSER